MNYALCRQSVTIYRPGHREVLQNVHLELRQKQRTDAIGRRQEWSFLLIVPGAEQRVFPGDRLLPGVGPEQPGTDCPVVRWAEVKYLGGQPVHTEAGA